MESHSEEFYCKRGNKPNRPHAGVVVSTSLCLANVQPIISGGMQHRGGKHEGISRIGAP